MNQEQINSLVRTVLKIAGTALAAHGMTTSANLVNSEDVFGAAVLLVGLWQSHQTHADPLIKAITNFAAGPAPISGAPVSTPGSIPAAATHAPGSEPGAPVAPPATLVTFHESQS